LLVFALLIFTFLFSYRYIQNFMPHPQGPAGVKTSEALHEPKSNTANVSADGHSSEPPRTFGWLTFIAEPLYWALRFLHDHGVGNWGWAIVTFTTMFNLTTVWPRMRSMRSSLKMVRLQPKIDAIKKRYSHLKINDPTRAEMNSEMMSLYREEGLSMFSGCLPMLLQMPLFFAYIRVLRNAPELHHAHWLWLTDLSTPDPSHILPVLIIASMLLTQTITPAPATTQSQRWMMGILMPVVMGFSLWHYASGLSLYWITGNLVNLLVQLALNQSEIGREMHSLTATRSPNT